MQRAFVFETFIEIVVGKRADYLDSQAIFYTGTSLHRVPA